MPIKSNSKRITVFQDRMVVLMLILLFSLWTASAIWLWVMLDKSTDRSPIADLGIRIMCVCCIMLLPVLCIIDPYRYCVWLVFSDAGIAYHTLFRRAKMLSYASFPYVLHGKYLHGTYWRHYLVFSDRRLSTWDLNHINHVSPSKKLIKLRYSEKMLQKLLDILPPKMRSQAQMISTVAQKQ